MTLVILNSGNYCALKVSLHTVCYSGAHRPQRPVLTLAEAKPMTFQIRPMVYTVCPGHCISALPHWAATGSYYLHYQGLRNSYEY